jgi:hypothetical protein
MTARIKRDSTWFYPDADSPEYSRALIKSLSETPEISAIARHVLGDKVMAQMEQAGIDKNLQLISWELMKRSLTLPGLSLPQLLVQTIIN